jgi:putative flippase GtrA
MVSLRQRFAELIPELAKFGVVGLTGSVVDLGGAAYLHGVIGLEPLVSKALSISAAIVVTYLGSRFWTFRHRVNQALVREGTLFVALNIVGLVIAECAIAFTTYGLDMKGALAYNAASVAGTGLGTIFRYFSYKKWVFLAGVPGAAVAAGEAAVSGIVDALETKEAGGVLAGAVDSYWPHEHGYQPPQERRYGPRPEHDYGPPREHGYGPPREHGYGPPREHGYGPPRERGYGPPRERGYGPPRERGYQPRHVHGYQPPQEDRYQPPEERGYWPPQEHLDPADADARRR